MKEPIRIISDLHLAHPGCQVHSVEQLRPLFEGVATVIFNGDTIEHRNQSVRPDGMRHFDRLQEVLDQMGVAAIFLRGNHDPGLFELEYLELANEKILVTHGDAVFAKISPWSREIWAVEDKIEAVRAQYDPEALATDLDTALAATHECRFLPAEPRLELSGSRLRRRMHSLKRIVWPPKIPLKILRTWLGIPGEAHGFLQRYRPEAKVLLFGHTHLPGLWRKDGRVVINTGGFRTFTWARAVDLEAGELTVRAIDERGGRFFPGRVIAEVRVGDGR